MSNGPDFDDNGQLRSWQPPVPTLYHHTPCSMATVAWTGGSHPKPYDECHPMERKLVDSLYQAQYDSFCVFWGKAPDGPTCELYRTRARYDAHATMRGGSWNTQVFGDQT